MIDKLPVSVILHRRDGDRTQQTTDERADGRAVASASDMPLSMFAECPVIVYVNTVWFYHLKRWLLGLHNCNLVFSLA